MASIRALAGATGILVLTAIAGSPGAVAADLGTVTWNGTTLSNNSLSGAVGDRFTVSNTSGASLGLSNNTGSASTFPGGTNCSNMSGNDCPVLNGSSVTFTVTALGTLQVWQTSLSKGLITIAAGGGGSGGTSSGAASTTSLPPPVYSLSISSGVTCTTSALSAVSGVWVQLPKASECTVPGTRPGATLLGWSTVPDFPVAIAQRQVDRGWGAYELFAADGSMTGVFIPAGGYALVSGSTTLNPVWSR